MSDLGRRPELWELLKILEAIVRIEADVDALNPEKENFRVVLTFSRAFLTDVPDWLGSGPKPSHLIESILEELRKWATQRIWEHSWVSKEAQMGSSIDTLMAHYTDKLKTAANANPQNFSTRTETRIYTDTVLRLKELKERRVQGGVTSGTESRREKARNQWAEDEYAAPGREEEQTRAHAQQNAYEQSRQNRENIYSSEKDYWEHFFGAGVDTAPKTPRKKSWHEILGVGVAASKAEIKKAHRKLVAKYHPDRYKEADGHERMTEINVARDEGLGGL